MKKTAVFGGTFNPPHLGHVAMLRGISNLPYIDKILVMPAKIPPHKSNDILKTEHRFNMCKLAFEKIEKAEISDLETRLEGKSYTYNTLLALKKANVKNLLLVIGADSLINFNKWYKYEEILSLAEIAVYFRLGTDKELFLKAKSNLEKVGAEVTVLNVVPPNISSTEIRNILRCRKSVSDYLPHNVEEYIKKNHLYTERSSE